MSNGHWGTRLTPLALSALIGGLLVYAYFDQTLEISSQNPGQEHSTDTYSSRAQDRIAIECTGLDAAAISECKNKIIQAAEESSRSENDLQQQSDMARWAFWMMVASGFSVLVTAIGIFYIRMTLDQTVSANKAANRAVDVTREIGNLQLRPHVFCASAKVIFKSGGGNTGMLRIGLVNFGETPAKQIEVIYGITTFDEERSVIERPVPLGGINKIGSVFPNQSLNTDSATMQFGDYSAMQVNISVSCVDPNTGEKIIHDFLFANDYGTSDLILRG